MDYTDVIKQKTTDELLEIHKAYNNYQKEFILQVEKELEEREIPFRAVDAEEFKKQKEQEEKEKESQSVVITQEYLKENTKIHGWLVFFLISLVIGGLISAVYPLATMDLSEYDGDKILAFTDILHGFLICGLAIFTMISFINRRHDAVFLGKTYIIVVFATNLMLLLIGEYESSGFGSLPQLARSLVWSVIWFCYLCFSSQVQKVIPKEYRKRTKLDYILVAVMVFVPLFALGFAFGKAYIIQSDHGEYIEDTSLKSGEYTDGIVAFTSPRGFECDSNEYDGIKVFQLSHSDEVSIVLVSDIDGDQSASNINDYWNNCEDEDVSTFPKELIIDEKRSVNSKPYYYKVTRYHIGDSYYYWRFIMLFDKDSSKVCVISCYDNGVEGYVSELLESIRFS